METVLEARALRKSYTGDGVVTEALRGVDLSIAKGEFVAIMGPSGCGKTTLLHLLGGLDLPTSGDVLFKGQSLSSLSDRELTRIRRRRIGMVFQFFNLIPVLTVEENIAFQAVMDGRRDYRKALDFLLETMELGEHRRKLPSQLSGGQQQRTAIARALLARPLVILADEPTGNIDRAAASDLMALLRRQHTSGQTIVLVTHDPTIASFAGRVVFMRDGVLVDEAKLSASGDPAAILAKYVRLESARG